MDKSVLISKEKCCGCGACIAICARKAISIKIDDYGFRYAFVDTTLCVGCGKCDGVCPQINRPRMQEAFVQTAYAASGLDTYCQNSSSGGIFALLAKEILTQKGVVFGTCLDNQFDSVVIEIDKIEDLYKLQGSKYVQSNMNDCYSTIKARLKKDTPVLFCGTPCQVAAVRKYLGNAQKLFLVDIVCHGVPNNQMFKDYLEIEEKKYKNQISDYKFRDKAFGQDSVGRIIFENSQKKLRAHQSSYYYYFLNGSIFRDSCYSCEYANLDRVGDITLCDYWGVANEEPEFLDMCLSRGINAISGCLVNSEKGDMLFNLIKTNMLYKQTTVSKISRHNPNLLTPTEKPMLRSEVLSLYKQGYEAVDRYYHKNNFLRNMIKDIYFAQPGFIKQIIDKLFKLG